MNRNHVSAIGHPSDSEDKHSKAQRRWSRNTLPAILRDLATPFGRTLPILVVVAVLLGLVYFAATRRWLDFTNGWGSAGSETVSSLPEAFSWQAYLKWNPELQADGITTRDAAEQHFRTIGAGQKLVYQDYDLTLRYTACGGLMNQHYCHLAALVLAHLCHAKRVIWPPMQERTSFSRRYHPNAEKNEQSWLYMDANSLWDLPSIQQRVQEEFGIEIIKHPDDVPIPDMTKLETAFQEYEVPDLHHESQFRFKKPIYIARHNPYMLARAFMDSGRQVLLKHDHQPSSVLVDLPCTLFMIDNRNLTIVEDMAKLLGFSPAMTALADKVIQGIANEGQPQFNGVHMRMEKDAADWAIIMGGRDRLWQLYKESMSRAGLSASTPLYIASGLLKAASEDTWSRDEMRSLTSDIVSSKLASHIVYKEMYLTEHDLVDVHNEQSGLIDFLVMRQAQKLVGIGVSTFSFYLCELRLMDGFAPADTELLMASYIGTDELFFSCGIAAISTRQKLEAEGRLPDLCRRPSGRRCYTDPP